MRDAKLNYMKKYILMVLLFLLLLIPSVEGICSITFQGQVRDLITQKGVCDARVTVKGGSVSSLCLNSDQTINTDQNGYYNQVLSVRDCVCTGTCDKCTFSISKSPTHTTAIVQRLTSLIKTSPQNFYLQPSPITGNLQGYIKDFLTSAPLANANMMIDSSPYRSDLCGFYAMNLGPGRHDLYIGVLGYCEYYSSGINVANGSVIENVSLIHGQSVDFHCIPNVQGCVDNDGDGYYTDTNDGICISTQFDDCNDANPNINPGASDVCGTFVDYNCDKKIEDCCIDNSILAEATCSGYRYYTCPLGCKWGYDVRGIMVSLGKCISCIQNDIGAKDLSQVLNNYCLNNQTLMKVHCDYGKVPAEAYYDTYLCTIKCEYGSCCLSSLEDCTQNILDKDCDGLLPEYDPDCIKYVWTQPDCRWKWDWQCNTHCSCDADAWNIPDRFYNPAEHYLFGMDPANWNCVVDKTYMSKELGLFLAKGINFKQIGAAWILYHVYESLPKLLRDIIDWAVDTFGLGGGFSSDELKDYGEKLPEPSCWTYVVASNIISSCADWDSVYSLQRDWVCFKKDFSTEKIFDWRNKDGKNWVTPVRDQGSCGSCWAFSAAGATEAVYQIKKNNPNSNIDLSEQDFVSCSGAGSCGGGWPYKALYYMQDNGVVDESCFSYTATNNVCSNKCTDWTNRLKHASNIQFIETTDAETIKFNLRTKGPLSACFDFSTGYFDGDIWKCNNPDYTTHCITLVGYSDYNDYWIAKNSWGSSWGSDGGYFKIGYGQCFIENKITAIGDVI